MEETKKLRIRYTAEKEPLYRSVEEFSSFLIGFFPPPEYARPPAPCAIPRRGRESVPPCSPPPTMTKTAIHPPDKILGISMAVLKKIMHRKRKNLFCPVTDAAFAGCPPTRKDNPRKYYSTPPKSHICQSPSTVHPNDMISFSYTLLSG